jgi:hypothetical protein
MSPLRGASPFCAICEEVNVSLRARTLRSPPGPLARTPVPSLRGGPQDRASYQPLTASSPVIRLEHVKLASPAAGFLTDLRPAHLLVEQLYSALLQILSNTVEQISLLSNTEAFKFSIR